MTIRQPVDHEDFETAPFCVERRTRTISRKSYWEAIQQALTGSGNGEGEVGIDLIDFERSLLPSGRLEFLVQTLPPPILGLRGRNLRADDTILWRGKLYYAEGRSMPVWARVRLWIEGEVCVLAREVTREEDLQKESDCVIATTRYFPFAPAPLRDCSALDHTTASTHMTAAGPIYQSLLVRKPDVEMGKSVDLTVVNGGAQVRFRGKAAGSAHTGESVTVTNPDTGKRCSRGKSSVETP